MKRSQGARVCITFSTEFLMQIDGLSEERFCSRVELIREAVRWYLKAQLSKPSCPSFPIFNGNT